MNKYKEKIGNILNKVKGNKRILYLTFCTVSILFCLVLNVTFAKYTDKTNNQEANITIGDLKYKMTINEIDKDDEVGVKDSTNSIKGDRIIHSKAGKIELFDIVLNSLNEVDTKYEIIYKVCTDENCTSFETTNSDLQIRYNVNSNDKISGNIAAKNTKTIGLVTQNSSTSDFYVLIGLNVGYIHNELILTNQIDNTFNPSAQGNLKIIAYVDGKEVESFPTNPNYETTVQCMYNDGTLSSARGVFTYNDGWKLNVYNINETETTCSVNFTTVLYITYDILSANYNCSGKTPVVENPIISYTGACTIHDDGDGNWRMKLLTSGELTVSGLVYIDAFLVGGGGGGSNLSSDSSGGGGGGGGYTRTEKNIRLDNKTTSYQIVIGSGGAADTDGTATSTAFGGLSAAGGKRGSTRQGGAGGSGGGGGQYNGWDNGNGGSYGSNGTGQYSYGGAGQGSTTCEFGEGTTSSCTKGTAYAYSGGGGGGGCGAGYSAGTPGSGGLYGGAGGANNGTANRGGGGGGHNIRGTSGSGGSGVVVIRNVRQ